MLLLCGEFVPLSGGGRLDGVRIWTDSELGMRWSVRGWTILHEGGRSEACLCCV